MSQPPRSTTRGVAAHHALIAARRPKALVSTALRTRSVHAREVLVEAAWPGHSLADIAEWARRGRLAGVPPDASPARLADLARVLAVQSGAPDDEQMARELLEQLVAGPSVELLQPSHLEMLAQLRVLGGDPEGAVALIGQHRVRSGVAASVRADALNPHLAPGTDPQLWASAFSRALGSGIMAAYLPPPDGRPDLDALQTVPVPVREGEALITVLMSAYQPGPELMTAVRSVLNQSYGRLELFVVDDASPDPDGEVSALLREVARMDPRVRVIRKAVNGGTYRARNTALRQASGDFCIVIDSDDWWHPQTLEICLGPLLRDPSMLATRAQCIRVTPDLVLTRPGYVPRFPSAATVLFRRLPVLNRVGFFDPTRKGADTEYARRIEATFGPVIQDVGETTTILRGGGPTLSSEEFANGYRHPARHQYKSLYSAWHERIRHGSDSPFLDPDRPRRFPEPARWSRPVHSLLAPDRQLDVVFAGDWRRFGGPQASMVEEIRAAREANLRVGVMHLEALRFMTTKDLPVSRPLIDLVEAGEVAWVLPDDDVAVDLLMLRYPPILQYPPMLSTRVRVNQVLVVANQGPLELDGSDQRYVVSDVTARALELFGAPVTWVPQSPAIRQLLLTQDPSVVLTDWDNPGLIDLPAWRVRPPRDPGSGGRPVRIGRHSRDDRIKFPQSWGELQKGYAFGSGYEVHMLGGERTVATLAAQAGVAQLPSNWTVLPVRHGDVRPFLADLDFYLYLDNPTAVESFGRTLLEAAASGVLVIAHPKHRLTFGDVLDYAEPGQAQELIESYVADPRRYHRRVRLSRALVERRYGHAGFVAKLRPWLTAPREPASVSDSSASMSTSMPPPGMAPLLFRLSPGSAGDLVEDVEGAQVAHVPLRSGADAERTDGLAVIHHHESDDGLRAWLAPLLPDSPGPEWSPTELLRTAPTRVSSVILARDGVVLAAGRGRWISSSEPDEHLLDLVDAEPAAGWSVTAWRRAAPPHQLTLEPSGDQSRP